MKIKLFTTMLCFFILTSFSYSIQPEYLNPDGSFIEYKARVKQEKEYESHKYRLLSPETTRNYDVLKYDLELDWTTPLSSEPLLYEFEGVNNITVLIKDNSVTSLDFDARSMLITGLKVKGVDVSINQPINNVLNVSLPNTYQNGDTVQLSIAYKFTGADTAGFYLFPKAFYVGFSPTGDSVFTEERIAYTMSEPIDARLWMPCNDAPNDKAVATIRIKVPEGYTAVSNGLLEEVLTTEDNNQIFVWADTSLIPTYLMSVTASKFVSYNEWYKPNGADGDSIELVYYVWEKDLENEITDWTVYNAKNAFAPTMDIMKMYSERFIPYPFRKYGQVAIQPFNFGGMEHQTITAVNRSWLRGTQQAGIAHEMAHHWLGDLVTCEDWDNLWFNEGGATWSEAIWAESWGDWEWYLKYMESISRQYFLRTSLKNIPIFGIPTNQLFSNPYYYLSYHKASWVYHQLRIMLGDEVFFPTLRSLLNKYAFSNMNFEKFQEHFENEVANPAIPFEIFFDQWIKKAGHPVYMMSANSTKLGDSYEIKVRVEQTQGSDMIPEIFHTYLPIVLFNNDKKEILYVVNDQRVQDYSFQLDFQPDSIKIETRLVLAEADKAQQVIVSVEDEKQSEFFVYPNVTKSNETITIFVNESNNLIELYDFLGNKVEVIGSGYSSESNMITYKLPNLTSGQYFIKLTNSFGTKVSKIIIN